MRCSLQSVHNSQRCRFSSASHSSREPHSQSCAKLLQQFFSECCLASIWVIVSSLGSSGTQHYLLTESLLAVGVVFAFVRALLSTFNISNK